MTYEVVISSAAQRDLDGLPQNLLSALRTTHFPRIAANPRDVGRPKKGRLAGVFGYDFGPRQGHRILYEILEAKRIVLVIAIGTHDQACRSAERCR
jgi:mRNA-degrading endonuclease RelE of RelBE toxin-antitoxin system